MRKVLFVKTQTVAKGDGTGPTFEAGKAYYLRDDSVEYWRGLDAVVDAPEDMSAENRPAITVLRPDDVRIVRTRGSRYNVVGPDDYKFNKDPLSAHDAEKLRQSILNGDDEPEAPENPPVDYGRAIIITTLTAPDLSVKLYAAEPWPQRTCVAKELLAAAQPYLTVDGNIITFDTANGMAIYVVAEELERETIFTLQESTYEPAPALPPIAV